VAYASVKCDVDGVIQTLNQQNTDAYNNLQQNIANNQAINAKNLNTLGDTYKSLQNQVSQLAYQNGNANLVVQDLQTSFTSLQTWIANTNSINANNIQNASLSQSARTTLLASDMINNDAFTVATMLLQSWQMNTMNKRCDSYQGDKSTFTASQAFQQANLVTVSNANGSIAIQNISNILSNVIFSVSNLTTIANGTLSAGVQGVVISGQILNNDTYALESIVSLSREDVNRLLAFARPVNYGLYFAAQLLVGLGLIVISCLTLYHGRIHEQLKNEGFVNTIKKWNVLCAVFGLLSGLIILISAIYSLST